jgi:hypothetical protein
MQAGSPDRVDRRLAAILAADVCSCFAVSPLLRACVLLCTEPAQPLGARDSSTASAPAAR